VILFAFIRPEFTPSLLFLLALLPAHVGKLREKYNGKVGKGTGESEVTTVVLGCITLFVVYVGAPATLAYSLFPRYFRFGQLFQQRPEMIVIGTVLAFAGIALTCWARLVLAGNWVGGPFLRDEHKLVTTGPYRWVRHPMYSGFAVFHIGVLVATGSIVPLIGDGLFRAILLCLYGCHGHLLAGLLLFSTRCHP
jgi:protein-S-isoprenylcysteine O-methyltransferase Ste14